jgi:hypothetical protein
MDNEQPSQVTELQAKEFAAKQLQEQNDDTAKEKMREDNLLKLISAFDKGVVTRDEMEDTVKMLNEKIAILEGRYLKDKARGYATIPKEVENENEKLAKLYPGLVERGLLKPR